MLISVFGFREILNLLNRGVSFITSGVCPAKPVKSAVCERKIIGKTELLFPVCR